MESTIYGLDETATKDELLASVPDQYKDHFRAFMDITNESEQKKILKYQLLLMLILYKHLKIQMLNLLLFYFLLVHQ